MEIYKSFKNLFITIFQLIDHVISYLFSNVANEKELLNNFFGNKNVIYVDIGTNLGANLIYFLKYIKIKKAYLFEPNLSCYKFLKSKFKDKKYIIINKGIGKHSVRKFYDYEISSQSSFFKRSNNYFKQLNKIKSSYKVKIINFDKYFVNYKIDFCKIDVEGMEFEVLKSMSKSLKKIRLIKIEINCLNNFFINQKSSFNKIVYFFNKHNFALYSFSKLKYIDNRIFLIDAYFVNNKYD